MKKILIPVHSGFEETELITTLNVLSRNKIDYTLWSIEGTESVKSSHEAYVNTDPVFPANLEFDGVFFHGGPAVKNMVDYDEVLHIAKTYADENKVVAAICAAPEILLKAGVLNSKKYTAYEGRAESDTKTSNDVEIDGKLVTGKSYSVTQKFAETLVEVIRK